MGLASFKYSPFESCDMIRLLHIDYSHTESLTLKGTIFHIDRNRAVKDAPWIAISYRWGEARDVVPMSIRFQTGGSLDIALLSDSNPYQTYHAPRSALETLQALYDHGCIAGKMIWIDALCINQADLSEKGAQVRAMGDIYSLSSSTVVYLGPSLPWTAKAVNLMSKLESYPTSLKAGGSSEEPVTFSFQHLFDMTSSSRDSEEWLALRKYFERPWFARTWVTQEAVLSQNLHFVMGQHSLPWQSLEKFINYERQFRIGILIHGNHSQARKGFSALMNIDKLKQNRAGFPQGWRCTVSFALYCCDESVASDPRDKVYGLLGLLHDPGSGLGAQIIPDYSMEPCAIYTEVTRNYTAEKDTFDMIYSAGIGRIRDVQGLPSWVPDLSRSLAIYPFESHRAGKVAVSGILPLKFEGNDMVVQAFLIDTINSILSPQSFRFGEPFKGDSENDPSIRAYFQGAINLMKAVHTGFWSDTVFENFVRTLLADLDTYLERSPKEYISVCESLDVVRDNAIRSSLTSSTANTSKHDRHIFSTAVAAFISENTLCMSARNSLGIVPSLTKNEDLICVCPGSRVPFIIRPTNQASAGRKVFQLVGYGFFLSLNDGKGLGAETPQVIILR